MTDNEKTDLKEQISSVIKSRINQNGHIERTEIRKLFENNLALLDSLIEELKDGHIIRTNPSGTTYLSGLKFKSFKTYRQFIDEINNPKPTVIVEHKTPLFDKILRYVLIILSAYLIYQQIELNTDEKVNLELRDSLSHKSKIIDSLTIKVQTLDSLLQMERDKLKNHATASLDKIVK